MMALARNVFIAFFIFVFLSTQVYAGTLTGKLVDAKTGGDISGAQVDIYDASNLLVGRITSGSDGTFRQENLSGHYTLRIVATGYTLGLFTADVNTDDVDLGNLLLIPQAKIHATVKDNSSSELSNGSVRAIQDGNQVVAYFEGASGDLYVSAGEYDVIFSAPYYTEETHHVSLAPGDSISLDSSLEPTTLDTSPVVQSVSVSLSDSNVSAGSEVVLTAIATYIDGHTEDVTAAAQWDVDGAGALYKPKLIATVAGTHNVRATFDGKSGTSPLTVNLGDVRALSVSAIPSSAYTGDSVTLTSTVVDKYGNTQPTTNVNYTTSCGSINNGILTSQDACTAVVTSLLATNGSINGSVTVQFTKKDTGGNYEPTKRRSSSSSGGGGSSTGSNSSSSSGSSVGGNNGSITTLPASGSVLKLLFSDVAYVGDSVTVNVLDSNSNPVSGVVIVVVMPDGREMSLVTDKDGKVAFVPALPGDYIFKSSKYVISGVNTLTVNEVPLVNKPAIKPLDMNKYNNGTQNETATAEVPSDMVGVILAAFSGEISPADAIKATMPLWMILGALIFAAAIFFVVYTFMIGNPSSNTPAEQHENAGQSVMVKASSAPQSAPIVQSAPEPAPTPKPAAKPKAVKEPSGKVEREINELEEELREKMARLKKLKEQRGY